MPTSRPDTAFSGGVCSACLAYDQRALIDWESRRKQLLELLDRHNGRCIVPSSGGKDSTYQVLTLLELGADVTVVTATTCHLTPIGRRNIDNLSRFADTIEITPSRQVRAKLNRLALKMVGDISWPEHVLIHTVPFRVALDMKIPLVFYGENPTNQYGGPSEERQQESRMTRQWTQEFGGFLGLRPQDFIGMEGITEKDMRPYMGTTDVELDAANIEVYFLGQFLPWDSHVNAEKAIANGFEYMIPCKANWWPWENQDNLDTYWHDRGMFIKYGYGRLCAQISVDIRAGRITREQAMPIVEERDGLFCPTYMGLSVWDTAERIGLSRNELETMLADYGSVSTNHPGLVETRQFIGQRAPV